METNLIEYKRSWRDEYLDTLCAFANCDGGIMWIGVEDDGSVSGVTNLKVLLENIPAKITNSLNITAKVDHMVKDVKDVLRIEIAPSSSPVALRGRFYTRMGSTTQTLEGSQLTDFLLRKTGKSWVDVAVEDATLEDIDIEALKVFQQKAEPRARTITQESDPLAVLTKLKLTKGKYPTRAGLMLFGKNPGSVAGSAFVQIGSFSSPTNVLQTHVVEGRLMDQADEIMGLMRSHYVGHRHEFRGTERFDVLDYPEDALREAVANAIIHKDYSGAHIQIKVYPDHIWIWNPGGVPDGTDINTLKGEHSSNPRNTSIATTFYMAGKIERWGRGTNTIVDACRAVGLPDPEFKEEFGGFSMIIRKDKYNEKSLKTLGLNERQIKAVMWLKEHGEITNADYQQVTESNRYTATRDVQELVDKGIFNKIGTKGSSVKYILGSK